MDFGLTQEQTEIIFAIFEKYLSTGIEVIVYGSRAKGNYTNRSDIDLVIKNDENIDTGLLEKINEEIEESDFPYLADIQLFETIKNPQLIQHINRAGKILWKKSIS
jgi:predicted nucleotidyltransferase